MNKEKREVIFVPFNAILLKLSMYGFVKNFMKNCVSKAVFGLHILYHPCYSKEK